MGGCGAEGVDFLEFGFHFSGASRFDTLHRAERDGSPAW